MAQNFIQDGDVLEIVNGGTAITSGSPVVIGSIVGIALGDIAANGPGRVQVCGVFEVAKTTPLVIAQGDKVYWSTSTSKVTKTATDAYMGIAFAAAGSTDATVQVSLSEVGADTGKAAVVAAVSTANGSDAATTQALANQLKTTVNAILTALKDAGLMANA
jgi:predicted RecA/RadA family phage recombinase